MNYGCKVLVKYKKNSPFDGLEQSYRNITEIHYNYNSILGIKIAFESDIHQTGITCIFEYIEEFKTELETKKEDNF